MRYLFQLVLQRTALHSRSLVSVATTLNTGRSKRFSRLSSSLGLPWWEQLCCCTVCHSGTAFRFRISHKYSTKKNTSRAALKSCIFDPLIHLSTGDSPAERHTSNITRSYCDVVQKLQHTSPSTFEELAHFTSRFLENQLLSGQQR